MVEQERGPISRPIGSSRSRTSSPSSGWPAAGVPVAAVRPGQPGRGGRAARRCSAPPTSSTATSPATSTRSSSSARSSTRWPTASCSSSASAASSSTAPCPRGSPWRCSCGRSLRRRRARSILAAHGRPTDRRHLVREGRHLLPHDRLPALPGLREHGRLARRRRRRWPWLVGHPRPRAVLVLRRALRAARPPGAAPRAR